ncbi:MAG: 23S rRNA (pseudouridine(1915)-N(3))-methyltransferase RlmH [Candidatus Cloacimonetes bacterium]|nr:23S rRNA (pseudouridine(1915)-N(3))-methyltransferase RlmH [Candidatus Cloacimonadota bacterium]
MNIKILCLGKTKQKFVKEGISEYEKRLSKYIKIDWMIIPDVKLCGSNDINIIKEKEAERILGNLSESAYIIALDENGKALSSKKFAELFRKKFSFRKEIIFVIGGVYGLSKRITSKADLVLSFSNFTFTHQIIRLLLTEQIYRTFTIIKGKKYHY